jgi:hypothetical protein
MKLIHSRNENEMEGNNGYEGGDGVFERNGGQRQQQHL